VKATRGFLVLIAACWLLVGVAYLGMSSSTNFAPKLVAVLALLASMCTWVLAFHPQMDVAYRFGGAFAIGALLFRMTSIFMWLSMSEDPDPNWGSLAAGAVTVVLSALYWKWWLTEVRVWHESDRLLKMRWWGR
jgi:hypothetical protein